MRAASLLLVSVSLVAVGGCKSMKTGAREWFSKKYSCPEGQISLTPRDDIKGSQLVPPLGGEPPDEVKNDPARLEVWKKTQAEDNEELRGILDGQDVFEARGCGHAEYLGCYRYSDQNGSGESGITCNESSVMKPKP